MGDWTVIYLGGDLKRKQEISGRLADILSDLYLLSATLNRYEDDGRMQLDQAVVDAIARDCIASIETSFAGVIGNFPNVVFRTLMGILVFPLGRHARPAADRHNYRLARAVLRPGALRDRLISGTYESRDARDPTGLLEDALRKVTAAEEVEAKFVRAIKKGIIERRHDRDAITDAVEAQVLTQEEASVLRLADLATEKVIRVDDFAFDELARSKPAAEPQAQPVRQTAPAMRAAPVGKAAE